MPKISELKAREILDSRGEPTLEVEVALSNGQMGRAAVPSGASTGTYEAIELRDGDRRFFGKGVELAISHVAHEIAAEIKDNEWDQTSLDQALIDLDGTPNKSRLGANAILGVSMAFAQAAAKPGNLFTYLSDLSGFKPTLPTPLMNVLNGGRHAANSTDIQEFMIIPIGAPTYKEAVRWSAEVYHALKNILTSEKRPTTVGDEGGFAPGFKSNEEAIDTLMAAVTKAGYNPGHDFSFGLDVAASEFYQNGNYELACDKAVLSREALINLYESWSKKYPLALIEDGLEEDDWDGWASLTERLGSSLTLVGDDLFVTNVNRLKLGIEKKSANALLIKLNQVGTVSETIAAARAARAEGYKLIVSHRSGETEDTFIAHLAVGLGAEFIKSGAPARGERTAKYNELLRIADLLEGSK